MTAAIEQRYVQGATANLAVFLQGPASGPAVVMNHSILSSSAMWMREAEMLAARGCRVIRVDTCGHGASTPPAGKVDMDALAADTVAVLDALGVARAHYVGLSLGGMSGFGVGIHHADRLLSLVLCDARADAPPAVAMPWDERIATAQVDDNCAALAAPTIERWFGSAFVERHPDIARQLRSVAQATSVAGFVACARAIQSLDYLDSVGRITAPTTLIVGENDGVLPDAMRDLVTRIPGADLRVIAGAGHLPNIDQPDAFAVALVRHFDRCPD